MLFMNPFPVAELSLSKLYAKSPLLMIGLREEVRNGEIKRLREK